MVRRRASKSSKPRGISKKDGSIKRWNTREDIPFDEVDEFHEQRDKILLEGEAAAQDSDCDDDEVFALKGLDDSSEEEEDFGEEEEAEEEEQQSKKKAKLKEKWSKEKTKSRKKNEKRPIESSDEEPDKEEEEEESWGLKKSTYYSSNAAQIESDDEEARQMEEQEARRLQAKLRAPMREEDFGYSEALQRAREIELKPVDDFWKTQANPVSVPGGNDKVSVLRHLQKTNPETLALAFEWEDIAKSVIKTNQKLYRSPDDKENKALGLVHLHYQTLLTYSSLLAFYLHLRASEKYASRPDLLRQHPILSRLLTLKQSLSTFEALNFSLSDSEDEFESEDDEFGSDESDDLDLNDGDDVELDGLSKWRASRKLGLEPGELEELLAQVTIPPPVPNGTKKQLPKVKLRVISSSDSNDELEEEPLKKKQKTLNGSSDPKKSKKKSKLMPSVTFDVEEPTLASAPPLSTNGSPNSTSNSFGYGEPTALSSTDITDKTVRRKALRFHTAKIEGASARRKGARGVLGGDDDVPYRQREKEKLKKKGKEKLGQGGEDLDEVEEPEVPRKRMREEDGDHNHEGSADEDDEDGYYSLVKRDKHAKKAEKKAQYEAAKASILPEGPASLESTQRAPTRAILANKGLTPKRSSKSSKASRNPRVKKRQKFEKAKKKLASQKAIYKGSGDPGKYGGETSGISKVVKSVKL